MYDVVIVGGGVSGLTAAISLVKNNMSVLLLEKESRVGQKLLLTGNGKANLSNINMSKDCYNSEFVEKMLKFSPLVGDFFAYIGLQTKVVDGRIYPYSETATSVLNLMRNKLSGVDIVTDCEVATIQKNSDYFLINNQYKAKKCMFCTGSSATKGKDSHFLLQKLGHDCTPIFPAIVPLITDTKYIKNLAGIRAKAKLCLYNNDNIIKFAEGEILFKNNGISGIVSMELSSYLARDLAKTTQSATQEYSIVVDFAPDISAEKVKEFLQKNTIDGLLHSAIASAVEKQAKDYKIPLNECIKGFVIDNVSLNSIKYAQVTCGGLCTSMFNQTMQSRLIKDLYACGEVVDIDGDCGGYNLHWAFLSALLAVQDILEL